MPTFLKERNPFKPVEIEQRRFPSGHFQAISAYCRVCIVAANHVDILYGF